MADYDMIVIGAGPAGQKAALQAAKLHKRVAVIERAKVVGGACVSTGTLPSKTLRETVHYLSGLERRKLSAGGTGRGERITMRQLLARKDHVIRHEIDIIESQLHRNHVDLILGEAAFDGENTISVKTLSGMHSEYTSDFFVIATGSRPVMPEGLDVTDPRVLNSDTILDIDDIPKKLTVVGGGVIGCEYACVFARLGSKVTVVDRRQRLLRFLDNEITDALAYHMRSEDICLKFGEDVEEVQLNGTGRAHLLLRSGKVVVSDRLFYSMGRRSNVDTLNLEPLGVEVSETGLVGVNEQYQTGVSQIYAVGDVIGFPALASTAMEQGRLAACHAFGEKAQSFPSTFPYGIFTIPEISYAGATEWELTKNDVPYEVGRAEYSETARGQILGDDTGMLKLLFHRESRELLGVHIIGESATELVHIGQSVIAHKGVVDYFIDNVFNYPTLAECYKVAALNGVNRLV